MVTPDTEAAVGFLVRWSPGGPWVLSAIEPDGDNVIETRTFREEAAARKWIDRWQGKRNVYFSVNTPKSDLRKKATKTDIGAFVALHVDLDAPASVDPAIAKAEQLLPRLKGHLPPPTVIIDSGGGLQGFWMLREPAALNGPDSITEFERYNRGIETALAADHCYNIDRIMRLPGTVNLPNAVKREKGREVYLAAVVEADWERRYDLTDFQPAPDIFTRKPNGAPHPEAAEGLDELLARLPQWVIDRLKDPVAADRSKALFASIKALINLDLDDSSIERVIRTFPGGISSKYTKRSDLAGEIARVRTKTAAGRMARGKPGKFDDAVTDEEVVAERARIRRAAEDRLAELNKQYAVVNEAGKIWVFEQRRDPMLKREVLDRISFSDFKKMYQNRRVEILAEDRVETRALADFWLSHPDRRQYIRGVTFDPQNQAPPEFWNLWRGFDIKPRPGNWRLMMEHIYHVICAGNDTHTKYLLDLAARMFQSPQLQGEVAVVLRGKKGCGKGALLTHLQHPWGQHGVYIANSGHLVGKFNDHLRDCVMLYGDEAFFAGDKQGEGVLKSLITETRLPIEGKYKALIHVPNMLHIWLASNAE
jgi:hypothetical protein